MFASMLAPMLASMFVPATDRGKLPSERPPELPPRRLPTLAQWTRRIVPKALPMAALIIGAPLAAQGRVIIRPCPIVPPPCGRDSCPIPMPNSIPLCGGRVGAPQVERTESRVRVTLADRVLRYEVTETFQNRGGNLGEADYLFPLPSQAAFEDLRLEINGELVAGETMNADRARAEYERIVREQRDPALVEWMGFGLLRARIFPFNAGQKRTVAVRYQQVAPREGDALRIEFRKPADDANGSARTTLQLELPTVGYGEPYSPTHDITVRTEGSKRIAELRGNTRDVVVLIPVPRINAASIGVLTHAAGPREKFVLVTIAPPWGTAPRAPRDVTFVLDVSGSMAGGKLAQAKAAGRQLLATLSPDDRFRLVDFSTDVRTFRDEFVPATRSNVAAAEHYLDDLRAEGSTNISGALQDALFAARRVSSERLSLVLFVTDGEPTVGLRNPSIIADSVRAWRGGARVFTFGLGEDVNAMLVEQLALDGRGLAHFVRPDESVEHMVSVVAERLQRPLVTDVRVEGEGVRLVQQYPSQPADLYAGQELVVLARYEGNGHGSIRVSGNSANGRVEWRTPVDFPDRSEANAFVPRLWATQRIGWLSAERRREGASTELDDELRSLGTRYGIPTELTSYMVREPASVAARMPHARSTSFSNLIAGSSVASADASNAPATASIKFEQAKAASAERSTISLATLDSVQSAMEAHAGATGNVRRSASNRSFELKNGVWTEVRPNNRPTSTWIVRVQPFSTAWFALARTLPAMREALSLGDRVRITGTIVTIEVAPDGVTALDDATLLRIKAAW